MSTHGSRRADWAGRVRTAVIPAAGHGTRMLPATKSVPKELLPLGERPALQYVLDEAFGAGVDHVVIVSSPSKPTIADYLRPSPDVEAILERQGRGDLADQQRRIGRDMRISIVMQETARGLGHAVGCARAAVGDEPFFVMLPDELMESSLLLDDLCDVHLRTGSSVVAVKPMPTEELFRYGVVSPVGEDRRPDEPSGLEDLDEGILRRLSVFDDVVEKPVPSEAPSNLAIIGRYLLTSDIFEDLDRLVPGASGELQLTDALASQARRRMSCALESTIHRRDIGNPTGWVQAVVEHALDNRQIGPTIEEWLREVLDKRPDSAT